MTTRAIPFGSAVTLKGQLAPRMLAMGYCTHSGEVICEWLDKEGRPNVWGFPQGLLHVLAEPTKRLPWRTR